MAEIERWRLTDSPLIAATVINRCLLILPARFARAKSEFVSSLSGGAKQKTPPFGGVFRLVETDRLELSTSRV